MQFETQERRTTTGWKVDAGAMLEKLPVAILVVDDAGLILDGNPEVWRILDGSQQPVLGKRVSELLEGLSAEEFRLGDEGRARRIRFAPAGREACSLEVAAGLDLQPGIHVLVLRDVTELQRLRSELEHRSRLETIGKITSAVAHDFNNMITAILSYAELQMQRASQDEVVRRYAQSIQAAAERASETARQLLLFCRGKQLATYEEIDLNEAVREAATFVGRLIGEDIRLVLDLEDGLPAVVADRGELNQVLVNLAVNARDAMPNGGQLLIGTSRRARNRDRGLKAGDRSGCVSVLVHDTGSGISSEVLPHIFDPFFTTKAKGKGTGLGLATVYRIVRQSKGEILVSSEPGRGTTFEILLPAGHRAPVTIGEKAGMVGSKADEHWQILD